MRSAKRALCIFICLCALISLVAHPQGVAVYAKEAHIWRSVLSTDKKIALTFDDGPHPRYTERILDVLAEYGICATFFLIGENIGYYDDGIVRRMIDEGHEIGNHTQNHGHTARMSEESFCADVRECDSLISDKFGYRPRVFRPPEGYVDQKVKKIAEELGYDIILWSIDTRDWEHATPSQIVRNIEKNVSGGDIILMHDYVSGKSTTVAALRMIIPRLLDEGFEFVSVSELIKSS